MKSRRFSPFQPACAVAQAASVACNAPLGATSLGQFLRYLSQKRHRR
jgi:hypothetical protein